MAVMGVARFERFFRTADGLDVDREDIKRYEDFVNLKIYDLLIRGEANAKANGRDVVMPHDLPITKGLQERIHEFRRMEESIDVKSILEALVAWPPLDLALLDETEARLPEIAGGLSVALSHGFRIIAPDPKNPASEHWDRVFHLFELLL